MSDDPGHEAAEEIMQQAQDDYHEDMVRMRALSGIGNWTHCKACYIRRDHVFAPVNESGTKVWRCGFCGVVNEELTRIRKNITAIAENHLKENPKEE